MEKINLSESRGKSDLSWLKSRFSFSFADYYNPERIGFGRLLVLNDDIIYPGNGFAPHSHENMEIITLVYLGELLHKDNLENTEIIKEGEMQVMSAGRGITHSEYNNSKTESLELFQIWIETSKPEITPRHDKRKTELKDNELVLVVSGDKKDSVLFINQDAKILLGKFNEKKEINYNLRKNRGLFVFVINGDVRINDKSLSKRDSIEVTENSNIKIESEEGLYLMVIDVPI